MPTYRCRSTLPFAPREVFAWHARPGALERLIPPWRRVRVLHRDAELREGARVELELSFGPLRRRWIAAHRDVVEPRGFSDVQLAGPFRWWRHEHRFEPHGDGGTGLEDELRWQLPLPPLGDLLFGGAVRRELRRTFPWRHLRIARDLARHREAGPASLRVVVSGASGLVGRAFCAFLQAGGHRVDPLVRRPARPGSTEISWDPAAGTIDAPALEGCDAIVHLAGENVFALRWSAEKKRRILESRILGTKLLAHAAANLTTPPRAFVSASAVGYYGDRGSARLDEDSPAGRGFLADVCREWEAATKAAAAVGIRVVRVRIGIVLAAGGGALASMLPAFRFGLGARLGGGDQWTSWIALEDLVGVLHRCLWDDGLRGPVNAVAPEAVTNAEFTRTLAKVLRRPAPLRVPASLLRTLGGEMARETLLSSARVAPRRLQDIAFPYLEPKLEDALRWELGLRLDPPVRDA